MGNREEIIKEITTTQSPQDSVRRKYLKQLHEMTGNDVILYVAEYPCNKPNGGAATTVTMGDVQGFMTCLNGLNGDSLDLIIHSPGGSLEAAEQIISYLRAKYRYIRAIIPQNAMSAATMISCACDEIMMGKHSAIGPIDPQMTVPSQNGPIPMPAHSILEEFEKAKAEVTANPKLNALWAQRLMAIPPGFLDLCEKTIDLSKSKVGEWLNKYMFKDGEKKGEEIAEWLGDFKQHKTHGHPISSDVAIEHGLNVSLLEKDQKLQDCVLSIFHSFQYTFETSPCVKIIENHNGKGQYVIINKVPVG